MTIKAQFDSSTGKAIWDAETGKAQVFDPTAPHGDDCEDCFPAGKTPLHFTVTFLGIIDATPCPLMPAWPSTANRTVVVTQIPNYPCRYGAYIGDDWVILLQLFSDEQVTCWWLSICWRGLPWDIHAAFYCTNEECVIEGTFNNALTVGCDPIEACDGSTIYPCGIYGIATLTPGDIT